jgi:hypothetical protein
VIHERPNLSNAEFFRMHETLTPARIEALLDGEMEIVGIKGVGPHIQEGMGQFPAEDFLAGAIERLNNLAKRLRGDNKAELLGCIEALDDIAQTTFNASDYGRDELRKALAAIVS